MEEEERSSHQAAHTAKELARVDNFVGEQHGNNRTTCTAQERARINRLVGENRTSFNESNAINQRNYQHNQGANTAEEEFKEYLSTFDNDEKRPLESHSYVVVDLKKL